MLKYKTNKLINKIINNFCLAYGVTAKVGPA